MRNFILLLVLLFSSKIMAVDDSTNIKLYDRSAIVLSNYTFKYSLFTSVISYSPLALGCKFVAISITELS